jgi:hypothetical protein
LIDHYHNMRDERRVRLMRRLALKPSIATEQEAKAW